jgi:hypothetical protein
MPPPYVLEERHTAQGYSKPVQKRSVEMEQLSGMALGMFHALMWLENIFVLSRLTDIILQSLILNITAVIISNIEYIGQYNFTLRLKSTLFDEMLA